MSSTQTPCHGPAVAPTRGPPIVSRDRTTRNRKARPLLYSCVRLIVHSNCLVYNNTKPLLPHFTCISHRVPTRPLSHLTLHSSDGEHCSLNNILLLLPRSRDGRDMRDMRILSSSFSLLSSLVAARPHCCLNCGTSWLQEGGQASLASSCRLPP
jgi:hypothetical protein